MFGANFFGEPYFGQGYGGTTVAVPPAVAGYHTVTVVPLNTHTVTVVPLYYHTVTVEAASP